MKNISVLLILVLVIGVVAGCSPAAEPEDNAGEEATDVVTTASITDDKEVFKAALGADGTWIVAALTDFSFDEALVLEGTIDHEGTEERKIALYEQDEDRNITEEYTLTTPSLTIKSDDARIKGGTIDGDLYVEGMNFQLQHVVVTGDVYFANADVEASFAADEDTTIEGEMIVEGADVVSAASITDDKMAFKAALGADGTWIAAALADFTFEEELVLEGTIDHDGTEERKIALYEQDEDRNITAEYTLTTPSLTIKSDDARIKGGTIDGDLYVEGMNFQLQHVVVTGDVYFANADVEASFAADEDTTIEGAMMDDVADVVSAASITDDPAAFKAAMGADGTWIAAALADFTFEEKLVLEGTIDHEGTEERKIALYEQDEDRNITEEYTLTTPSLTIKSDDARIKGGTIDGDLYVEGMNFQLQHVVVTGDVYFANEDVKSSFAADEDTTIEGEMIVE